MPQPVRFFRTWLIASLALLTLVAGFNALIDPYAVFGTPRVAKLNAFKTASATHAALSKTYEVERIRPTTVLIGSSTVDIGLDPEDSIWPKDLRPVFDYGVPGSLPQFQYRALQQADAAGTLKLAIIVLSFVDALQPPAENAAEHRPTEDERRLRVTLDGHANPGRVLQELKDTFLSTLTIAALGDSVSTVLSQWQPDALNLTEHGSTTEGAFRRVAKAEGYATLFELKEEEYARKLDAAARQSSGANDKLYWLNTVEQMLAFCQSHHIRPVFVIAPYHADMLDLIDKTGLWQTFETWKIALADLVQRDKSAGAALWDFTNYDQYSTEEVPAARGTNAAAMRWFWEPVHFKKALGSIVLRRVLLGDPAGFGTQLTSDNVGAALAAIRSARQAYWEGGGASASRVSSVVARVGRTDGLPTF